jgi:hypothetical protein
MRARSQEVSEQVFLFRVGSCDFVDRLLYRKEERSTKSHEPTRTKDRPSIRFLIANPYVSFLHTSLG